MHHRYALYKPLSLEIATPEDLPTIQALLEDVEVSSASVTSRCVYIYRAHRFSTLANTEH